MTGLPTANEIAFDLIHLSKKLDAGASAIKESEDAYVRAKGRYERARAIAVLKVADECRGDKTILAAERDAKVLKATYQEWLDLEVAEADVRKAREDQKTSYSQVEIKRSLNAYVRAEMNLAAAS